MVFETSLDFLSWNECETNHIYFCIKYGTQLVFDITQISIQSE